ncbi:tyrosine-type recombinase/integrase [Streptomyces mirabilis]
MENSWVQGHVAKLVEPPRTDNRELKPWTLDETLDFLAASRGDPLYATFVLAIAMGLRRGEIIGLRRSDLDLDNRVLYVRQQTQRRRDVLHGDDPKSRRRHAVPLPALCIAPLRWHRMRQSAARAKAGEGAGIRRRLHHPHRPPGRAAKRLRSFTRIADSAGIRVVRLHDARHGTATLLTAAGVAPRRDGDPRAQSDQHGRLHARRLGHAARGHESHGWAAQKASRSFSDRAR